MVSDVVVEFELDDEPPQAIRVEHAAAISRFFGLVNLVLAQRVVMK